MAFLVVEPRKIIFFIYKILYPKRRIYSYSILGTIVSPNKILLIFFFSSVGTLGMTWVRLRDLGFRG